MTQIAQSTIRCPTCRLVQDWSETCRRCKSDLRLLRAAVETVRRNRERCLQALQAGRPAEARQLAARVYAMSPTPEACRLMAICALHAGDWPGALVLGRRALEADEAGT